VRTVVFRGFLEHGGRVAMKMITDARSDKVTQIGKNNAGEMVWWFFKSSEQYRVSGTLQVVGPTDPDVDLDIARMQQWSKLTDAAREQFYWLDADVPGRKSKADIPDGGRDKDGNVLPPPDNFLLMLLWPEDVDYLRLRDNYRQVDRKAGDEWDITPVFP
jgi:hypothetical protein